ncbi:hypothetical protein D3C72_2355330 [compost metagenome]
MDNGGHRRSSPGAHVSRRTRNGGGGGNAAKERSDDITRALADKLGIGVVLLAGHAIQHHGTQQGFNRTQHGHGECRR